MTSPQSHQLKRWGAWAAIVLLVLAWLTLVGCMAYAGWSEGTLEGLAATSFAVLATFFVAAVVTSA